ncbi:MAG: DUF1508 domain-containing protein [Methylotenera sp.]|jgi:hypothetical protein
MYFQIYQSGGLLGQQWRWRLKAANHKIIADSGEAYFNEVDCIHGIQLVMGSNHSTPVIRS